MRVCYSLVSPNNICYEPNHICVHHPRCHLLPVCYPASMIGQGTCPAETAMNTTMAPNTTSTVSTLRTTTSIISTTRPTNATITIVPQIPSNARWSPNGITVAGGNDSGDKLNQLYNPHGLYVDDDQTVYVTDCVNQRIVQWKSGATSGQVVAGGNGAGNRTDQLYCPSDVTVDKQTDSVIICDKHNQRVVRWPRQGGTSGEILIWPVECEGLTMDDKGFLYVCDTRNHEVRRWRVGETSGTLVAGGKGQGNRLDQLSTPSYISVGLDQSVYVSDLQNDRVMKWINGAKEGIVVAGGQGIGSALTQVGRPKGVVVDQVGTVYVADFWNYRVTRWPQGATWGSIVVGGNGAGNQTNQLSLQGDLSFDPKGNLYVVDLGNNRVQKFQIIVS